MIIGATKSEREKLQKIEKYCQQLLNKEKHLSHSAFSSFLKSPAHFIEYKFGERTTTNDKEFGKLFDMFLLEPEKFKESYIEYDIKDRPLAENMMTKKENKAWKLGLKEKAEKEGKVLVESKDVEYSRSMAASIGSVSRVKALLDICDSTQEEVNFIWEGFKWLGFKDRSSVELTIDLKTTVSAEFYKFKRSIRTYGYHRQGVIYNLGDGNLYKPYFLLAVEKKKPFPVSLHHLTNETLSKGKNELQRGLERFRECIIEPNKFLQSYEFWANKTDGIFEVIL